MAAKPGSKFKPSDYVHLHNHTHYSLLDGLTKVPNLVERVKDLGMEAVAITDHGTLSGSIELYKEAKKAGIKPIIGIETYLAARKHTDKDPQRDKQNFHLVVLAMNNQGYENLMRLSTIASLEGFYYRPRIDRELLEKYNEGLIVLSGCIGGEVGDALRNNQYKQALEVAKWYKSVFGDRYYLELQDHAHQWEEQARVNEDIKKIGKELDIPCVVTCDAHYLKHDDQTAHEILLCVQTGSLYEDENRMSLKDMDLYVEDPKDMLKRWSHNPEYLTTTKEIADRCEINIDLGNILIPKFPLPKGKTEKGYLEELTYQGLAWRYGGVTQKKSLEMTVAAAKKILDKGQIRRAEFELSIINKMGFDSYFLIVADFVNWGKKQGIVFGPGRGSAAGSIVSYALNITDLDPIDYGLLFERFLNPDRISMPDIDIDIQDSRRDEVIEYCVEKYGQDRIAHIVTFGTMAARNAIRDVARVLNVPYADADRLAKLVPPPIQGRHIPLATSIKEDGDLKAAYENEEQSEKVIDLAVRLEGTIRSHGVHAAGVVIAPDEIVKYAPLEMAQKGVITTQYSMGPIEELGLLKMDFLGLSNLTIIKNALRIIKKVHGKNIDITSIPLDDKKTFDLLGRGETTGVFQLESSGMKRYIRELKPDQFEDIIAMVALYRPGPLTAGLTDRFIARKRGKEKIVIDHETMKEALEPTHGVLVYQEQVMQIAQSMAGFSGGQADTLRKAIGKKKREVMAKMKKDFIQGARDTSGVTGEFAENFWKSLEGFADYAFNKSHAACYAMIAYQTAYLKANYPSAFMAALMTSDYDDNDRLAIEISECRHMGLEVLPPDVNQSFLEFAIVPKTDQIRFGMAAIKNIGKGAVEEILRAREADGEFTSIEDFARRVNARIVNRKVWESLIRAGAFDSLNERATLLNNLDTILSFAHKLQKESESGQTDLFGGDVSAVASLQLAPASEPIPDHDKLQWERELLGIYLSRHPLERYKDYLQEQTIPISKIQLNMDGASVTIGGTPIASREINTRNGQKMAFVTIEDFEASVEIIVFPDLWGERGELLSQDQPITISGRISTKDKEGKDTQEIKILASEIAALSDEQAEGYQSTGKKKAVPRGKKPLEIEDLPDEMPQKKLYVHIKDPNDHDSLRNLKETMNKHPGTTEAILVLGTDNKSALRLPFKVDTGNGLQDELEDLLSKEAVVLK